LIINKLAESKNLPAKEKDGNEKKGITKIAADYAKRKERHLKSRV